MGSAAIETYRAHRYTIKTIGSGFKGRKKETISTGGPRIPPTKDPVLLGNSSGTDEVWRTTFYGRTGSMRIGLTGTKIRGS